MRSRVHNKPLATTVHDLTLISRAIQPCFLSVRYWFSRVSSTGSLASMALGMQLTSQLYPSRNPPFRFYGSLVTVQQECKCILEIACKLLQCDLTYPILKKVYKNIVLCNLQRKKIVVWQSGDIMALKVCRVFRIKARMQVMQGNCQI